MPNLGKDRVVTSGQGRSRGAANRERVAVVGSGIAGLTAAYLLQRRYDVALYEADHRLGGHAHTHDVLTPDSGTAAIDTGFIVHNERTYPHLIRLFDELGIATQPAEMSMSVRCEGCGLEYAGAKGLGGLFAQARSITRPAYLRMLVEVKRFHRTARRVLESGSDDLTLGEFLRKGGYSTYFCQHFVVPFVSCVWSTSREAALGYPARYLFSFLDNHGMLSVTGSPEWRTVVGGSRRYVEKAAKELTSVRLATPVRSISRHPDALTIRDVDDSVESFSRVVVATHADTALRLLENPSRAESDVLGAFGYSSNHTVLHTDERPLPRSHRARSSWNYVMPACTTSSADVMVSYDMNRLQQLETATPFVVSLNARDRIDPDAVIERMDYEHPIYTVECVAAQRKLPELNDGRIAFAGAYHGWGFHEDGCRSGAAAARSLGAEWDPR
jgi:predicted NAD/FAD-binding protein